jgi:hypothetical protein
MYNLNYTPKTLGVQSWRDYIWGYANKKGWIPLIYNTTVAERLISVGPAAHVTLDAEIDHAHIYIFNIFVLKITKMAVIRHVNSVEHERELWQ